MAHHRPRRLASTVVLLVLLTACGDGSEPDGRADIASPPSSASPATEQESAAKDSGSGTLSTVTSDVSPEAAVSYTQALGEFRPTFDTFSADYADAMARMDAKAVRMAASALRQAVAAFDAAVRGLDLDGVQRQVDVLLALNDDFIATLDDVGTATSGAQAVRIMEMLPFREYVLAYEAVAEAF